MKNMNTQSTPQSPQPCLTGRQVAGGFFNRLVKNHKGFALIIAVIMMLVFALAAGLTVSLVSTDSDISFRQSQSLGNSYIARAGIERALKQFKGGTACGSLSYTNTIGSGSYTTTATRYNPASTALSAGIGTSDTTIPVNSTTGYAPHGRITIVSEAIDYTGTSTLTGCTGFPTSPACFTGAKRGANGTPAGSPSSGTLVAQDYCLIRSTATITSSLGDAQRVIETGLNGTWPSSTSTKSFQTGTLTIYSNGGTNTVPVTLTQSVDMTKSFLIFNTRSNKNEPRGSTVRGQIASNSTLQFIRDDQATAPGTPIDIRWYVVEYASGVKVQRGEATYNASGGPAPPLDVGITAVADRKQAFVIFSSTPHDGDIDYGTDDPATGQLTTTSNLQIMQAVSAGASGPHKYSWQVVEFTNASDINVQNGTYTPGTTTAANWTVTSSDGFTAVDPTKTFVLVGFNKNASSQRRAGHSLLRAQLYNSGSPCAANPCNQIYIDRFTTSSSVTINRIVWQAITLNEGSKVQWGSQPFGNRTTLPAAIDSSVTTIRVASITNYGSAGRVRIDSEDIDYTGTSNVLATCGGVGQPCLTGATRGANGTTAAAHLINAPVGNSQKIVTLGTPVGNINNAVAFASDQADGAQSMGRSAYCTTGTAPCGANIDLTNIMGVGTFTMFLSATNKLTIERNFHTPPAGEGAADTSADVGWYVVEFPSSGGGGGGGSSSIIDWREVYN